MTVEIFELRRGPRFVFRDPMTGTFGPIEVTTVNISLTGLQLKHALPLRIGTHAKLVLKRGDVNITVHAQIVWSHLAKADKGLAYRSGLRFDSTDAALAASINALYRSSAIYQDKESLDRKRERLLERERQRAAKPKSIPSSEPPPS